MPAYAQTSSIVAAAYPLARMTCTAASRSLDFDSWWGAFASRWDRAVAMDRSIPTSRYGRQEDPARGKKITTSKPHPCMGFGLSRGVSCLCSELAVHRSSTIDRDESGGDDLWAGSGLVRCG